MALVDVTFQWDDKNGECEDCGRPAAFFVETENAGKSFQYLYCSSCAATYAADGSRISWIDPEMANS